MEKNAALLLGRFLFFSAFLGLMGPSVASGSSEVVSPDDGL
jgi:hypothetical protein